MQNFTVIFCKKDAPPPPSTGFTRQLLFQLLTDLYEGLKGLPTSDFLDGKREKYFFLPTYQHNTYCSNFALHLCIP